MQDSFNDVIRQAVSYLANDTGDSRIRLVDLAATFPDNTITCGDSGRPQPYINGVNFSLGAGIAPFLSKASFHPREEGQAAFGEVFNNTTSGTVPLSILAPEYDYFAAARPFDGSFRAGQRVSLSPDPPLGYGGADPTIRGKGVLSWEDDGHYTCHEPCLGGHLFDAIIAHPRFDRSDLR